MSFIKKAVRAIKNALGIRSPSDSPGRDKILIEDEELDGDPECGLPFVTVQEKEPKSYAFKVMWLPDEIYPNNWLKMHGRPMRRNCGKRKGEYQPSTCVECSYLGLRMDREEWPHVCTITNEDVLETESQNKNCPLKALNIKKGGIIYANN